MLEFILERANYWAIVVLMMMGLYIVFASQNMIKRLVGLSIFQTTVFFLYITLGKVAGGTAPILYGDDLGHHGHHGDTPHGADDVAGGHGAAPVEDAMDHMTTALNDGHEDTTADLVESVVGGDTVALDVEQGDVVSSGNGVNIDSVEHAIHGVAEHAGSTLANTYSNPLPHVLILTAIVVGVATLSVGLALIVRIREVYGTVEMDEVRAIDLGTTLAEERDDAEPAKAEAA